MSHGLTSATRLIALLGNPVGHSVSPIFQNAAFRAAGVDGVYLALRCDADAVPGLIAGIARAGGGGNVTVPHKEIAARTVEHPTPAVERTGACNTWWLDDGRICGDNTDVFGSVRAIRSVLPGGVAGARVVVIGSGGAARAALAALEQEGADEVVVLNRTPARAEALARSFRVRVAAQLPPGPFDLAINATPLGMYAGDALPLDPAHPVGAAFDMVYRPGGTPWVRALRERGTAAATGAEMLLWQGVAAFERWWGVPAPREVMRDALVEALGSGP